MMESQSYDRNVKIGKFVREKLFRGSIRSEEISLDGMGASSCRGAIVGFYHRGGNVDAADGGHAGVMIFPSVWMTERERGRETEAKRTRVRE